MKNRILRSTLCSVVFCTCLYGQSFSQTVLQPDTNAQRLSQRLLGNGVTISNCRYTGGRGTAGFFKVNNAFPSLGIDSGIVLSTGYIKTGFTNNCKGIDNVAYDNANGLNRASSSLGLPGDADMDNIIAYNYDAAVLEFDFVPTGDSIAFRYVFGSEEYPQYNCTEYNDVFAFFVSGPGITGKKNIALVPGTNIPVAINSVNSGIVDPLDGTGGDHAICGGMGPGSPFVNYYVNNLTGQYIGFNGFTKVMVASQKVQPCQVYHLKLVIADGMDRLFDSGVFLEAKSLKSSGLHIQGSTPLSNTGKPYMVEGCTTGGIWVKRQNRESYPQQVMLTYAGTATNGADVQLLPSSLSIQANDSAVFLPIVPIADQITEGNETLKIYVSNACSAGGLSFIDSIEIEMRDFQKLNISPQSLVNSCKGQPIQLQADTGFYTYTWTPAAHLTGSSSWQPQALTVQDSSYIVCVATKDECTAKDSVQITYKSLKLKQKEDVLCRTSATGKICLSAGTAWVRPLRFGLNSSAMQADSNFTHLPIGNYWAKVQDATGCVDSMSVAIGLSPQYLRIDSSIITQAQCTDSLSGGVSLMANGGSMPYRFAIDGGDMQTSSNFHLPTGSHFAILKDANDCRDTTHFRITYNNTITLNAGPDAGICKGSSTTLQASTNSNVVQWSPSTGLSSSTSTAPVANPVSTTNYIVTARNGFCVRTDTVQLLVRALPIANAGQDTAVCTGSTFRLNGSGGLTYKWLPDTYLSNTITDKPVARPQSSITYQLTVTDQFNCTSTNTASIKVRVVPPVLAFAGHDTAIAAGQPLQLTGKQLQDTTVNQFSWNPIIGLNNNTIPTPVTKLYKDQTYNLTLRTPEGCEGKAAVHIKVYQGPEIYVPTGFTPNKDGKNDVLRPIPAGIKLFKQFAVFNRWGQPVFRTTVAENGWDGRVNGLMSSNETFVWLAEGIDYNGQPVQRKGTVVVMQ